MKNLWCALVVTLCIGGLRSRAAAPDVSDKVVLANLDRYEAYLKVGGTRREIKPKKASVLTPKSYPTSIEYWSGNTKTGWVKHSIETPGIYGFNFKRGRWSMVELKKGTTVRKTTRPSPKVMRKRVVAQPVRRLPINADRNRWTPLARAAYAASKIYQFVRDEHDRDLLRNLLIRAREDEDYDRLERWLRDCKIPELYKDDLREAFDDLARLKEEEWKEIDTADEKAWERAKEDLGGLLTDSDWSNLENDYAEIDSKDYWEDNVNLDLNELDLVGDVDVDQDSLDTGELDLKEDLDVDSLDIGTDSYDLGEFDDFEAFDDVQDVDPGDVGGGYLGDDDVGDFGGFDDFDF